jgi:hypothetical protein
MRNFMNHDVDHVRTCERCERLIIVSGENGQHWYYVPIALAVLAHLPNPLHQSRGSRVRR